MISGLTPLSLSLEMGFLANKLQLHLRMLEAPLLKKLLGLLFAPLLALLPGVGRELAGRCLLGEHHQAAVQTQGHE